MINFKCIRYKNILSTGNSFTEIDFTRNKTTLITGENGAGKSTMLDALSFALYGKPFRKINKPQLINSVNGKGLLVEVELSVGKSTYLIRRGVKPNVFEIHQNGKIISQQAAIRDYQVYFEKNILKMNHKSFSQVVVLGSSTFIPFMQLSAAQRRDVIEDLLDLQIFSSMNNLLKERLNQNKSDIRDAEYQIDLIEEKINLEIKHLNTMVTNHRKTIDEKNKQLDGFNSKIEEETAEIRNLEVEIGSLEDGIRNQNQTQDKKEKIEDAIRELNRRIQKNSKEINFFQDYENCPTCHQGISEEFKQNSVKSLSDKVDENHTIIEKLKSAYQKIENKLKVMIEVSDEISKINQRISEHNRNIFTHNKFITALNVEIKSLSEKVDQVKNNDTNIDELKSEVKVYRERKTDLGEEQMVFKIGSEMLRDSGIKSQIIKQYVPVMNKLINHYLQQLGFFVHFHLDENFNEKIKSRYRDEFSYESFSEGEKTRINIALLFTWRTIAKLRNSVSTNLLIMDEIFDSSVDNDGADNLMKLFDELEGTNLFVISHKTDWITDKFRGNMRFVKKGNFSRIAE